MPIRHLVVLMLENRSFDHLFGVLHQDNPDINGLTGAESNPASDGSQICVTFDANPVGDLKDPGHEFPDVEEQIYNGVPGTPSMSGFVRNFANYSDHPERIMKCFGADSLPVLRTLGRNFVLCDAWHSSVPGPTSPNRMFAHAATSNGSVLSDPAAWIKLKTIYEQLDEHGVSYRIYHNNGGSLLFSVDYLVDHQRGFVEYAHFADDCVRGDLPCYTFIEARYTWDGEFPPTDMHPDADVRDGENLVREVYEAIRGNDALWQSTLLLILFDEHGGIYDHVVPGPCAPTADVSHDPPFNFDRLGLRVPAIIVSPFAASRVSHQVFEHSSILATIRKLFLEGTGAPPLGREASAAAFDGELTLHAARTDNVELPRRASAPATAPASAADTVVHTRPAAADAPPTALAMEIVRHLAATLQRRMPNEAIPFDVEKIRTCRQAANFMSAARRQLAGIAQ